jgi:hypothetical protein
MLELDSIEFNPNFFGCQAGPPEAHDSDKLIHAVTPPAYPILVQ